MSDIEGLSKSIAIEFRDAWSASYYGDEDAHYDQTTEACISFGMNGAQLLVEALIKIIQ
jgi:hypothetical protein